MRFALLFVMVLPCSVADVSSLNYLQFGLSRIWLRAAKEHGLYDGPIDLTFTEDFVNTGNASKSSSTTRSVPIVNTTSGLADGESQANVHVFYEIPYAEPPVGSLRFQPPLRVQTPIPIHASENRELKCMQFQSECASPLPGSDIQCGRINMKEDCLVLNIYVPAHVDLSNATSSPGNRLPVMFYIHGGSFNAGSGYGVDGRELASVADVIVVTINYRLGPFGFLVNKESGKPDIAGNQGIKDQQLALEWVQENIHNFGGDKNKVTIFGGSAGAQSVVFHTLSAKSAPLYWNAILQSDPVFIEFHTPEESQTVTDWLVRGLCNDTASRYDCLMNADAIALSNRQIPIMARGFFDRDVYTLSEAYRPVIDGVEFTKQPLILYKEGKWNSDKNMIVGVQTEELDDLQFFLPEFVPTGKAMFTIANYYIFATGTTDKVVQKYSESYPPEDGDYVLAFGKEMSHLYFICPSRALARYASQTATNGAKVYFYANKYPVVDGSCRSQNNGSDEGCYFASHGDEVRFVMRTIGDTSDADLQIQNQFSNYWGSFARTGDPNNGLETSLGEFTHWPAYREQEVIDPARLPNPPIPYPQSVPRGRLASGYNTEQTVWSNIRITTPMSEVEENYEEDICDFWDSLGVYMEPVPLPVTTKKPATASAVSKTPVIEITTSSATNCKFGKLSFVFIMLQVAVFSLIL